MCFVQKLYPRVSEKCDQFRCAPAHLPVTKTDGWGLSADFRWAQLMRWEKENITLEIDGWQVKSKWADKVRSNHSKSGIHTDPMSSGKEKVTDKIQQVWEGEILVVPLWGQRGNRRLTAWFGGCSDGVTVLVIRNPLVRSLPSLKHPTPDIEPRTFDDGVRIITDEEVTSCASR